MRANTKLSKKQKNAMASASAKRKAGCPPITSESLRKKTAVASVTAKQFVTCVRSKPSCLCGDLTKYEEHLDSIEEKSYVLICAWCGGDTYKKCGKCNAPLHNRPNRGVHEGANCFNNFHNNVSFGLAREDMPLHAKHKKEWKEPSNVMFVRNAQHIRKIVKEC